MVFRCLKVCDAVLWKLVRLGDVVREVQYAVRVQQFDWGGMHTWRDDSAHFDGRRM